MKKIDWEELRKKYFQNCFAIMPDNSKELKLDPNELFDWFMENIGCNALDVRIDGQSSLFGNDDKELLFWESPAYVIEFVESHFMNEIHLGIDVWYYYRAVDNWASGLSKRDKRRKKSTRGWIKTMCNFMESDKKNGKIQMVKPDPQDDMQKMINFLKENE